MSKVPRFLNQTGDTLFAEIGLQLYGDNFTSPLAAELRIARRVVQRWANGSRGMTPAVWPVLVGLLREKCDILNEMAAQLEDAIARGEYPQRDAVGEERYNR